MEVAIDLMNVVWSLVLTANVVMVVWWSTKVNNKFEELEDQLEELGVKLGEIEVDK